MTGKLKKGQYGNIRIRHKTGEARASPASPLPTALLYSRLDLRGTIFVNR